VNRGESVNNSVPRAPGRTGQQPILDAPRSPLGISALRLIAITGECAQSLRFRAGRRTAGRRSPTMRLHIGASVDFAPSHKEVEIMVSFGRTSAASRTQTLETGAEAPDFELPGHRGGERFRLRDNRNSKNTVIVFYPLDWTPV
jgi:AhpC/TSA family